MFKCIGKYLLLLSSGLYAVFLVAAPNVPEHYALLSRASADHLEIKLDETQRAWLQGRQELVLGTSAPDYPPFDLSSSGRDYEGMTADYAGIIAKTTGLPMKVLRFDSREAAIAALERADRPARHRKRLRSPKPGHCSIGSLCRGSTCPGHSDERKPPLTDNLDGLRLSMVYHYLPPREIEKLYPKALITTYPPTRTLSTPSPSAKPMCFSAIPFPPTT